MKETSEEIEKLFKEQRETEEFFLAQKDHVSLARTLFAEAQAKKIPLDRGLFYAYLTVFVNNDLRQDAVEVLSLSLSFPPSFH